MFRRQILCIISCVYVTVFPSLSVCVTDFDVQVEELEEILSPLNKEQKTDWKTKIQALIHVIFIVLYS